MNWKATVLPGLLLAVAAHRLRQRYRDLLRAELAQTVADPAEVDDEIRSLFAVLGG